MTSSTIRLTEEKFILRAIRNLRTPPYKGINPVISGFNKAFRAYYGEGADPVAATKKLADRGVLVIIPAKKGVTIFTVADAAAAGIRPPVPSSEILKKILAG